jgi:hypothetical protein
MQRSTFIRLLAPAFALIAAAAWMPANHLAGPPWISIEVPPNPFDRASRDAFLLVHAFHHGTPVGFPVRGTAEGMVGGERRSVKLEFAQTSRAGVYALKKQWANDGVWTLVISVTQGPRDIATALVELGEDGRFAGVRVPTEERDGWKVPKEVSAREIDTALRARAARLASRSE